MVENYFKKENPSTTPQEHIAVRKKDYYTAGNHELPVCWNAQPCKSCA